MFTWGPGFIKRSALIGEEDVDPFFSNVSLLLHFEGAQDSSIFIDHSPYVKTVSRSGNTRISNSDKKFGTTCAYFGDDQSRLNLPASAFPQGTEDFTIECFFNAHSNPGTYKVLASINGSTGFNFERNSQRLGFYLESTAQYMWSDPVLTNTFTWYHAAVTRQGTTFRLFLDGQLVSSFTSAGTISGSNCNIGQNIGATASDWHGYIDEFRVTRGVCRYTTSFTPPSKAFYHDFAAGAAAVFSLRKARPFYTGSAIQVRRSSDNAVQDIGFDSSGQVNAGQLLSFVSGSSGFISTWYDQSGFSRNGTFFDNAAQPRIVNAGSIETLNGKISARFQNSSNSMGFSQISSDHYSCFFVGYASTASGNGYTICGGIASGAPHFVLSGVGGGAFRATINRQGQVFLTATDNVAGDRAIQASFITNSTSARAFTSGVSSTPSGAPAFTQSLTRVGVGPSAETFRERISEVIIYANDEIHHRQRIEDNQREYYQVI